MKSYILAIGLFILLIGSTLSIPATPVLPTVRLPDDLVTMNAVYGEESYFDMILSDIPEGFDITDANYHGWCVQKTIQMTQHVNHTVLLYSSYDPDLPSDFQFENWDKINYILNHKVGTKDSIQKAIWYYANNWNYSTDMNATIMVHDAENNGSGFIPQAGELLAIPIEGVPVIQLTFLELLLPLPNTLEGLVWYDSDANGLQNEGEPGIQAIMIHLYQSENLLIQTTTTNPQGYYSYTSIIPGNYSLQFVLPTGYRFSMKDVGSDDTLDSDADTGTGRTIFFTIAENESITTWDAGMYRPSSKRIGPRNHPPTADATAGEPYTGFAHEQITFNGSRSYDRDGRVTSWRWNFGDGIMRTGEITTHAYNQPGNYRVTLTVTDNLFASDMYTTIAHITAGNNPSSTPTISGPTTGHVNVSYQYTVISTDPDDNTLLYVVDWGDGTQDSSPFFGSGHSITTTHTWNRYGFYTMRIYAQDWYHASSNVYEMVVAIDVQYVSDFGYLIDTDSDGSFELFHSNTTGKETKVSLQDNGYYLIDTNGDGKWDIVYNPLSRQMSKYNEAPILDYLIFAILVISFILILYMGRKKKRSITFTNHKH